MLVGYSNCLKKSRGEKIPTGIPLTPLGVRFAHPPWNQGGKKSLDWLTRRPAFFSPAPHFFFSFFFLFLFFPSFFLVPVSPPINVANKNNERPPARTLHPLSVGAHSLVEWRAGEVWFAVRKGRRLLLQTASRQREDTGLCRVSFHVPLSLSLPLSPLYLVIFFLPPRRKKKREKKDDVRSRPSEPRMFKYFRCAKCGCRVKFCVEKFFLHRLNFSFSLHF